MISFFSKTSFFLLNRTIQKRKSGMAGSLQVEEHGPRVFDGSLDAPEEGDGLSPVDQPVVVGQGQVHHRTNHNLERGKAEQSIINNLRVHCVKLLKWYRYVSNNRHKHNGRGRYLSTFCRLKYNKDQ